MGILDKLFRSKTNTDTSNKGTETNQLNKGDRVISVEGNTAFNIVRHLTEEQKERIVKSTIILRSAQLYMHYWTDNLVCTDRNDPYWQNKVMFFWKAEEPFPKKSLPMEFETFKKKYFLFGSDTSNISLQVGKAIPWFGMPGLGEKHVCQVNGENVTIPELHELRLVDYIEQVELTNDNLDILTNRKDYFFLIDDRITPFRNGNFYLQGKPVSIDLAYSIGGIHILKNVELN